MTAPPGFQPRNSAFEERVRDSFAAQGLMRTFGAHLAEVLPGQVSIDIMRSDALTQQHGFVHGGVLGALLDTACGYAGLSLMDADSAVLTVEYKVNFLGPASGERFHATGRVVKPGRTLTVCEATFHDLEAPGAPRLIATASATLMAMRDAGLRG